MQNNNNNKNVVQQWIKIVIICCCCSFDGSRFAFYFCLSCDREFMDTSLNIMLYHNENVQVHMSVERAWKQQNGHAPLIRKIKGFFHKNICQKCPDCNGCLHSNQSRSLFIYATNVLMRLLYEKNHMTSSDQKKKKKYRKMRLYQVSYYCDSGDWLAVARQPVDQMSNDRIQHNWNDYENRQSSRSWRP